MHVNKLTSLGYGVVISLVNWHAGQRRWRSGAGKITAGLAQSNGTTAGFIPADCSGLRRWAPSRNGPQDYGRTLIFTFTFIHTVQRTEFCRGGVTASLAAQRRQSYPSLCPSTCVSIGPTSGSVQWPKPSESPSQPLLVWWRCQLLSRSRGYAAAIQRFPRIFNTQDNLSSPGTNQGVQRNLIPKIAKTGLNNWCRICC